MVADANRNQEAPIVRKRQVVAYQNDFVTVYDDEVVLPSGSSGRYLRIQEGDGHPGVAALIVHEGRIALVNVYRYPIGEWEWGIPRGFGSSDESDDDIRRELDEEVGCEVTDLCRLSSVHTNSGLLATKVNVYFGRAVSKAAEPSDIQEVRAVRWITPEDLTAEIRDGRFRDAISLAAITLSQAAGKFPPAITEQ